MERRLERHRGMETEEIKIKIRERMGETLIAISPPPAKLVGYLYTINNNKGSTKGLQRVSLGQTVLIFHRATQLPLLQDSATL
ncbi:hypothetical protein Pmani_004414 [Petrolisthes manimaculis]|uniref:Uncharacterized protein n=1 Tax=Petrolisthes manimaculis TaxID=1843537 RepID=A0AAE1QEP8_9EUCA|nr:hypothetical protein Pmani_004414 [Petrolisthes manimaculis]